MSAKDQGVARLDMALTVAVAALAAAIAMALLMQHFAAPDLLWRGMYHDRHGHYAAGQNVALAIRNLDPVWFLSELDRARVWPPVHELVLGLVLLIGGIDHRLGIVPSLLGWAVTVVLAGLIARRLFVERWQGIMAGAVAVTFAIASPAFRLLGSDVMLETLGAALSALSILLYLQAREAPDDRRRWRYLALTLTALFLEKGNYWGIVVAALAAAHLTDDWRNGWRWLVHALQDFSASVLLRRSLRDALLVGFGLVAAAVGLIYAHGPASISAFGRQVSLYPPENLATLAYAILFIWAALTWRTHRAAVDAGLNQAGHALLYWHAVPVAIYFLWPKRLSSFLWYIGPANNLSHTPYDPLGAVNLYWDALARGFCVSPAMAVAALLFAAVAVAHSGRFTPGSRAVLWLLLMGTLAVVIHPQHQGRFLGSWIFSLWVAAGAGAAVAARWILPASRPVLRNGTAAALVALLAGLGVWTPVSPRAYAHAIYPTAGPINLDLMRPYLTELDGLREVGVITTLGYSAMFDWMLRERCRCRVNIVRPWFMSGMSRAEVQRSVADFIARSTAERIVVVDVPHFGSENGIPPPYRDMKGIADAMAAQDRYALVSTYRLPAYDEAQATIWQRRSR